MNPLNPYASPALDAAAKALANEPQFKRLNPYAAPAAANESREAPYVRFVSCGYFATIAGACFVLLILMATRSGLWAAAAAFLSLELHFLQAGIIAWLTQTLSWSEPKLQNEAEVVS